MDMHFGSRPLHCSQNVAIVVGREVTRQTALYANFRRTDVPGFAGFLCDLLQAQKISVVLARTAAEGAEFASDKTDVGEIDVAVYYISHDVARKFAPQRVGCGQQSKQIVAIGMCQQQTLFTAQHSAIERLQY